MNAERLENVVINRGADMNRGNVKGWSDKAASHISDPVKQVAAVEGKRLSAMVRGSRISASTGKREV